ncbi:MAG TPA: hypothetical protein O0X39_07670 [Methanocorpusculum sp.]|nr:hypothetical protein [Methanocorpusculum sp.]
MGFEDLPEGYDDEFAQMCGEFAERDKENKTGEKRARREAEMRAKQAAERTMSASPVQTGSAMSFSGFETGLNTFLSVMEKCGSDWIFVKKDRCRFDPGIRKHESAVELSRGIVEFKKLLETYSLENFCAVRNHESKCWMCGHIIFGKTNKGGA